MFESDYARCEYIECGFSCLEKGSAFLRLSRSGNCIVGNAEGTCRKCVHCGREKWF